MQYLNDAANLLQTGWNVLGYAAPAVQQVISNTVSGFSSSYDMAMQALYQQQQQPVQQATTYYNQVSQPPVNNIGDINSIINNAVNNAQSTVSASIASAISNSSNQLSNVANNLNLSIGQLSNNVDQTVSNAIGQSFGNLSSSIQSSFAALTQAQQQNEELLYGHLADMQANTSASQTQAMSIVSNAIDQLAQSQNTSVQANQNIISGVLSQVGNIINQVPQIAATVGQEVSAGISALSQQQHEYATGFLGDIEKYVDNLINELVTGVTNAEKTSLSDLAGWWKNNGDRLLADIKDPYSKIHTVVDKIVNGSYTTSQDLLNDLTVYDANSPVLNIILTMITGFMIFKQIYGAYFNKVGERVDQLVNADIQPSLPPLGDILKLLFKDSSLTDYYTKILKKYGFSDETIKTLLDAYVPMFNNGELEELYSKSVINESLHDSMMSMLGYDDSQISRLKSTYFSYPNLNTWFESLRGGLMDNSFISLMNMNDKLPSDIKFMSQYNGVTDENARMMYMLGWQMPAIPILIDMLRRGIIDANTYSSVLQYSNITPYFRDKMLEQSYQVLNRRDISNLVKARLLDENGVVDAFSKLGYKPDDAQKLANYTIKYGDEYNPDTLQRTKELSVSSIENAFKKNILDKTSAENALLNIGYDQQTAEMMVSVWDYTANVDKHTSVQQTHKERTISALLSAYTRGAIPKQDVYTDLQLLGYSTDNAQQELLFAELDNFIERKSQLVEKVKEAYINNAVTAQQVMDVMESNQFTQDEIAILMNEADTIKGFRSKKVGLPELEKMLKHGIITPDDLVSEMQGLGYHDKYIEWYLKLLNVIQ